MTAKRKFLRCDDEEYDVSRSLGFRMYVFVRNVSRKQISIVLDTKLLKLNT